MFKAIGSILVVSVCGMIGFLFLSPFRQRIQFLQEWLEFNQEYVSRLNSSQILLNSFLNRYRDDSPFHLFIKQYSIDYSIQSQSFLKKEQNEMLKEYFTFLGTSDLNGQIYFLNENKIVLQKILESETVEFQKRSNLYPKLGILLGFLIIILFL